MHYPVLVAPNLKAGWRTGSAPMGGRAAFVESAERLTVLVVDDEIDLADVTAELLRVHGFDAVVAYSGADALRLLREDEKIAAVFSDVMMPEMTGLDLAEVMAKDFPRVKLVLTSGYKFPSIWAKDTFACAFLPKPYRIEAVIDLLKCSPAAQ